MTFATVFLIAASLLLRIDLPAAMLFPVLILALACNHGWFDRILASRIPYFLGVISFSIYLIHDPFRPLELALLRTVHPAPLGYFPALLMALAGSLSIIPFAWIAYGLVERPGRVAVRDLFLGWTRARRPAVQND
jgi:peptidoglycan/LPS O-acetylase OafA/YrhL